jgi:alkaline phosphatase
MINKHYSWQARLITVALTLMLTACSSVSTQPQASHKAKNVILLIGDGMGPQQVGLLLSYARQAPHGVLTNHRTAFDRMMDDGRLGLSVTHPNAALVVDSAASATQLAIGKMAGSEMIGVDKDGNRQATILDKAKKLGKATGLVSDTRITHATPAAFAAHEAHRSMETNIAEDLLSTQADLMFSGGLSHFLPQAAKDEKSAIHEQIARQVGAGFHVSSARKDDKNLLITAQQQGYQLVFNKQQLQQATGKTLGLFADSLMVDGITENKKRDDAKRTQPTLKEMTEQALTILSKRPEGFFLMVEGGQIDMAAHRNDTGRMLHEMLKFNDTLNAVLDWANTHPDTLIVVTADHETGGFGFSYSASNVPKPHPLAGDAFSNRDFKPDYNFGNPEVLDKLYAQQQSYEGIFKQFDALPVAERSAEKLADIVNKVTEFKISAEQAKTILTTEPNPFYQPDRSTLDEKEVPKMPVNSAFYPYQKENRQNLLAQAVATQQQVVWATGTHTSTPVLVFLHGATPVLTPFTKLLHHSDLGRLLAEAL